MYNDFYVLSLKAKIVAMIRTNKLFLNLKSNCNRETVNFIFYGKGTRIGNNDVDKLEQISPFGVHIKIFFGGIDCLDKLS